MASRLSNHLADRGENLPQLLPHQRHSQVGLIQLNMKETISKNLDAKMPKNEMMTILMIELSALGPEPTPDCFQFRLKIEVKLES